MSAGAPAVASTQPPSAAFLNDKTNLPLLYLMKAVDKAFTEHQQIAVTFSYFLTSSGGTANQTGEAQLMDRVKFTIVRDHFLGLLSFHVSQANFSGQISFQAPGIGYSEILGPPKDAGAGFCAAAAKK